MSDPVRSAYGNGARSLVKVRGAEVGFVQRGYEVECGIVGCYRWGSILTWESTRARATKALREHYIECHAKASRSATASPDERSRAADVGSTEWIAIPQKDAVASSKRERGVRL